MTMAYTRVSQETKDRAVQLYSQGMSARDVSKEVGCSINSVLTWAEKSGYARRNTNGDPKPMRNNGDINPLLLNLAQGNDLTPYIGREITKMQPREIFRFLELLNVEGDLTVKQTIRLK